MVTEYNDAPQFGSNCCRNDPTFSPLFNSLAVSELLNSIYAGAPRVPATINYFRAGDSSSSFCLLATAGTNCVWTGGTLFPFPQYYAFQLIASPEYLALSSGSYVTPTLPTMSVSLRGSAFYNSHSASLLLINPSSTTYNQITISLANTGISNASASLFVLNSTNPTIATSQVQLSATSAQSYSTTITIPPYSVVGVRIE